MDSFNVFFYKEPLQMHPRGKANSTEYFVVYGDTHQISGICAALSGKHYPIIKNAFNDRAIRGGWRIAAKHFDTFIELILSDDSFDKYTRTVSHDSPKAK